jgi:hypothetical protein
MKVLFLHSLENMFWARKKAKRRRAKVAVAAAINANAAK